MKNKSSQQKQQQTGKAAAQHVGQNQTGHGAVTPFAKDTNQTVQQMPLIESAGKDDNTTQLQENKETGTTPVSVFSGTVHQRSVTPKSSVAQLVKGTIVEGMSEDVITAIKFLNEFESSPSFSESMMGIIVMQLDVLERSAYAGHLAGLIGSIKPKIKSDIPEKEKPVPLKSKMLHSIWVQGDYSADEELLEGIETRKKSKAEQWGNLIWVYERAKSTDASQFGLIQNMVCRPIQVGGFNMFEVDFSETMRLWRDRPEWVEHFMPLLEILLEKKSFVTMSDIMRMIVLYYKGGLYMDVKIQLTTKDAKFFDEPLVNADKLQLVDAGMQRENWAMVAEAGCALIEKIMEATLRQFPSPEELLRMPENYAHSGKYSSAHKTLHEDRGPWNQIEKNKGKTDDIDVVNPSLGLKNPRSVNSWTHTDNFDFNWNQQSPWREMASNIQQLPPHGGNLSPQNVLLELTRKRKYDDSHPNFWAAYDRFRTDNPQHTYNLSPVQVINRINGQSPTRLYIMSQGDWAVYNQYKIDHPEFDYS